MEAAEAVKYLKHDFYGWQVHLDTLIVTWFIIVAAAILLIVLRSKLNVIPGKIQTMFEMTLEFFDEQADSMIGPEGREYTPIVFFIFISILIFNWIGLLPTELRISGIPIFMPPTRDINTTLALALCSFAIFNYYGFRKKGLNYLKNFIHPAPEVAKTLPVYMLWIMLLLVPLFLILNIVELLARVLSLSVRLFGNMLGEHIVGVALILFTTIVLKIFVVAGIITYFLPLFVFFLGVITGVVQAFIFAILTLTYISSAVVEYE